MLKLSLFIGLCLCEFGMIFVVLFVVEVIFVGKEFMICCFIDEFKRICRKWL